MHVRRPVQSDFLLICGRTMQCFPHATSFLGTCILYTKVSCREREKKRFLNYVPEVVAKIYLMLELFPLYQ